MTNTIPVAEATSNSEKTLYVLMHVKKSSSQMAVRPKNNVTRTDASMANSLVKFLLSDIWSAIELCALRQQSTCV